MAGEYDEAVGPGGVADLGAAEEHLVGAERDLLWETLGGGEIEGALVCVERVVGVL